MTISDKILKRKIIENCVKKILKPSKKTVCYTSEMYITYVPTKLQWRCLLTGDKWRRGAISVCHTEGVRHKQPRDARVNLQHNDGHLYDRRNHVCPRILSSLHLYLREPYVQPRSRYQCIYLFKLLFKQISPTLFRC